MQFSENIYQNNRHKTFYLSAGEENDKKIYFIHEKFRLSFIQAIDCAALNGLKFLRLENISAFSPPKKKVQTIEPQKRYLVKFTKGFRKFFNSKSVFTYILMNLNANNSTNPKSYFLQHKIKNN